MAQKKSGLSNGLLVVFGILVAIRIAMVANRKSVGSSNSTWDSYYLIWSIFLLIAIIVYFIWNQSQKNQTGDN